MDTRHHAFGFTLTELLVAMGTGAAVVAALLYFFSGSLTSYRAQLSHVAATADARVHMQRIVDTLRNAQNNGEEAWLLDAGANSITVWTDVSGDGTLEKVSYTRVASELTRIQNDDSSIIMRQLDPSQNVFSYYREDGTEILDPAQYTADTVKSIGITLAVIPSGLQEASPQTVTTLVTPRQNLQGEVMQVQGPSDDREVIVEVPMGNPPSPSQTLATVRIQNPSSGATISQETIPLSDLNDGRLRIYENDMYVNVNYKQGTGSGLPQGWYAWIIMNIPAELNSLVVPIRWQGAANDGIAYASLVYSQCMNKSWGVAQTNCKLGGNFSVNYTYMFLGHEPFQPLITYSADGYKDYVRDVIIAPPTLLRFSSSTANGLYGPGSAITITALYDEPIKSSSSMKVTLDTGREVTLNQVSGSQISGTYTVGAVASGENSNDLAVAAIVSENVISVATPVRIRNNSIVPEHNISTDSDIVVNTQYWADDVIGQYESAADASAILFTQGDANNAQADTNALGLHFPSAVTYDTAGHRLFVADRENHRVLVYNLNTDNTLGDRVPDVVLGQSDFTSRIPATTQTGMRYPEELAYDTAGNRLFVADTGNNRVLVYDAASLTSGQGAALVLGQLTFTASIISYHPWGMKSPAGLAYDTAGNRLFVADTGNHRVLVYDAASLANGVNSAFVLGQPGYESHVAGTSNVHMRSPRGLAYDTAGNRLFVADTANNRVLVFDAASLTNGEGAIRELGQPPETAFTTRLVTSPPTAWSMNEPVGLAYDPSANRLFVSIAPENRILIFDVSPVENGESVEGLIRLIGQPTFTATVPKNTRYGLRSPRGIAYDAASNTLFVADRLWNRVVLFSYE